MGCRKRQIRDYIHFIDENKSTSPNQNNFSVLSAFRVVKKSLNYQYNQSRISTYTAETIPSYAKKRKYQLHSEHSRYQQIFEAYNDSEIEKSNILYSGEQFDTDLQQQYLRARYYNQNNGTFNRLDPFSGNMSDPQSLHKYAYCHNDPVNGIDPTEMISLVEQLAVTSINFCRQNCDFSR